MTEMVEHRLETDLSMATDILGGSFTPVVVVDPGDSVVVRSFDASVKNGEHLGGDRAPRQL
jgi:hypothetical protein